MKILVCISNVPDTTTKISFIENNTQFNAAGVQFILNPYDEIALARAVELTEGGKGNLSVLCVGDASVEPTIRKALAIGAESAVRINSPAKSAYFVAKQIENYAKDKSFDMILFGRESIDYNGSQVCAMLAELLSIPSISICKKLEIDGSNATLEREIEGGKEIISCPLPICVSASEGMAEPKIPNMRGIMSARSKTLEIIEPIDVPQYTQYVSYELPKPRGQVKLIDAAEAGKVVELLHTEAKVI